MKPCLYMLLYPWLLLMGAIILPAPTLRGQSNYAVAAIPPELFPYANSVLRLSETTLSVENEREETEEQTYVVTIMNPKGKNERVMVRYENEFLKIKSFKARLFDAEGVLIRESSKSDIRTRGASDEFGYSEGQYKILEMDYHTFPFTVEFKVKMTRTDFSADRELGIQKLGQSVEQFAFTLIAPSGYKFQSKGINFRDQPLHQTDGDRESWRWNTGNLPALPTEDFTPFFEDELVALLIAPEKMRMGEYSGHSRNWKEVGQFFYRLNQGRDALSFAMKNTVQALTVGKNQREKIDALYRYLQQNHRYVSIQIGIGGWQTFPAQFVEEKKYGDCKALTNYMMALLKEAGIPAHQALVFGSQDGAPPVYADFPAPRFNHVILYLPGEDMWLECTSNNSPPGYLGSFTEHRDVLLLAPEGGKILRTPALGSADNVLHSMADIALDEHGNATVQNRLTAEGEPHDRYRDLVTQKKQAEIERVFVENAPFGIGKLHNLHLAAAPEKPQAKADYYVETNNYATRSGKRMFVPLSKINPFRRALPADDRRIIDLQLKATYTLRDTIRFFFPADFEPENLPGTKEISSEFGYYRMDVESTPEKVTVTRNIEIRPVHVPASRYQEVRKFYQDLSNADAAQMVLVKKL